MAHCLKFTPGINGLGRAVFRKVRGSLVAHGSLHPVPNTLMIPAACTTNALLSYSPCQRKQPRQLKITRVKSYPQLTPPRAFCKTCRRVLGPWTISHTAPRAHYLSTDFHTRPQPYPHHVSASFSPRFHHFSAKNSTIAKVLAHSQGSLYQGPMENLKPYHWHENNTECIEWFERDRACVRLLDRQGKEIICLWDEEVSEFVEDGFKSPRQSWHTALAEYATSHKLRAGH